MNKFIPQISPISFTKHGYEQVKKEYEEFVHKRKGAVETLKKARDMGDLSENGYYKAAKFELISIDRKLRELTKLIKYGRVSEDSKTGEATVGSTIFLVQNGKTQKFQLVGAYEADPLQGKISNISPIGKALIGKKTGESIHVITPNGTVLYTILKITT